ncbi:hypothetical protein RIF23_05500 [Lipingzhangella sp. LS1_29]|uniref:Uncharacterized protein n=1 Tax=Lipingzhangella rawalii TaxID=2055835 RepID=A0ABU2H366_9ACTN|nr:hypothetical protein [Lipingzhangella rawalii]MDS1269746.1 hypothetical protein [Lipingzhangella rawalii]
MEVASLRSQETLVPDPQHQNGSTPDVEPTPAVEPPEADAAEQRTVVGGDQGDWLSESSLDRSLFDSIDVPEADAVEQAREVGFDDEDEYR